MRAPPASLLSRGLESHMGPKRHTRRRGSLLGDARYQQHYERFLQAEDRAAALGNMTGEEIVQALAAASREGEPLLANVLATEAINRMRRVRTAIQHLGEGLCLVDRNGRVTLFNPMAERLTGWSRAEVEGRPADETLIPPAEWRDVREARRPVHSDDASFLQKGGARLPVSCTIAPVLDGGALEGLVIVFRDATRERRAARHREEWLTYVEACHEVHDVLGEGVVLVEEMRVVRANETFCAMSGYTLEELRALPEVTALVPEPQRPELGTRLREVHIARQHHVRTRLLRRDGEMVRVEVAAIAVQRGARAPRIICIVRRAARASRKKGGGDGLSGERPGPRGRAARP